jgi:hypothetical protein
MDRNPPRKHVEPVPIVLASVDGRACATRSDGGGCQSPNGLALAAAFCREGPDGLLHDKTRKPGKPPVPAGTVARVVALACGDSTANSIVVPGRL